MEFWNWLDTLIVFGSFWIFLAGDFVDLGTSCSLEF